MKEKIFKEGIKKRLLSVVLALTMVFTLMPMGGIVAYAATTPICRCDEHDQHVNIYKIENGNVYYYWYEKNTYQGMSNRTVSSFTSTYGTPENGKWYYSNYRSPVSAGECDAANAIPDCGCDGHDQHVYIYKIENGNVYYYWYEKNTYQGMSNRTVSSFTSTYGTPEQGNWYYSNYRSPVSAGTCDDASHFHTYNMTVWSSDASNHWHPATCSHSTQKKDAAAHGNWNATTGKCGTCGYECLHTGQTGATCAVCGKTLHTHTWEYSLDGTNTIKAHCKTAGHSGDDITLTLIATSPNYSGSTAPALYTAEALKTWTDAGCPEPTFEYYESADAGSTEHKAGATATTTFERGNYVAEATVGTTGNTATAKVAFNVTKKWTSADYPAGKDYIDYSLAQAGDLWDKYTAFGSSTTGFYVFKKETEMFFSDDGTNATGFTRIFISLTQKAETSTGNKYTFVADPRHKNWEYSVGEGTNANVLTAKCNAANHSSDDCHTTGVSLTLTASSANYSGSVVTARYGDGEAAAWKAAVGSDAPTITYTAKTGSSLTDGKAVNAGSYTASITVGTGADAKTATKDFAISKATPTVTAVPTASAITYGQTLANSTLTGGAASVQGAFAWTTSTTAPAVSDSGKTEYAVTFTPNDTTNYNTATCKVKVTVNKATGSGSVTMNGWTYGGTASDPVPTSTTNGTGSVTYAYKVKNAADSTYAAATPTNAGTYTVKATFAATDNYTQATATADFTIAKASQAAPAASEGYTLDYTDETLKAKTGYEVSSTNGETATALTGNKVNPGSEAKTCYVRKPASDTNHADSAWTMITIPARPAATDLTGTMETIKNKRDASLSGVTSAMEYRMGTETNWTAGTGAVIANPDNLTIYVRTRATAGAFAGETQTIEFTPGDKLLTVTMGEAAQNVAYGGKLTKPSPDPEKADFAFGGWYTDEACTQAWNFGDGVTKSMTLYPKWIKNAVQKAAISGNVTENRTPVSGATVELFLGTIKVAATVTNDSGNYSFDNVENGTYNIVVTKDGKTKTSLVTVNSTGSFSANVELPAKDVSSKVEHKGNEVSGAKSDIKETVVGGLDAIAAAQTVTPGGKVTIKLTVEPKAESDVASASEIKALAGNGKKVEFLDMSLWMQTNSESPVDIGSGNDTLLTIVIPFDFTDVDVSSVMLLRNHGSSEKLTKNPADGQEGFTVNAAAGTITIYARNFSTYAMAYAEQSTGGHGGGSYTTGHTVTSDLKNVTKVTIDGKVVDSRYYTVSGGNIILSGEFMKTLANGKHTVKLYDGAKVATGIMTVSGNVAVISAATGDMGVALYAALSVSSILGMGWVGKKKRDDE